MAIRGSAESPHIEGNGAVVDYAERMRQFPQESLASRVLARGALTPDLVTAFARSVAAFHAALTPARADSPYATPDSVIRDARANFKDIAQRSRALGEPVDADAMNAVRDWTERELAAIADALRRRRGQGCVRECHGDLHLGNIVLLDGALVAFDCIEFSATLDRRRK